jgi:hypothetical protein
MAPAVKEAGWALGLRKISPPPRFDPQTFQHTVCCYTDNANPAHMNLVLKIFKVLSESSCQVKM